MGIAASQAKLMMIVSYKSDLEFAMQMIAQKRTVLAYQAQDAAQNYPELAAQFHTLDKELESEMQTLGTQEKMVSAEYDSVKKTLDENIKRSMNYNS
jgi:ATP-dependent protease ClpP protease subunit